MLERLLAEIKTGGPSTPLILARRMDTSVEMVTMMLEKLVQLGMINTYDPGCADSGCQACAMDSLCKKSAAPGGKMWTLMD